MNIPWFGSQRRNAVWPKYGWRLPRSQRLADVANLIERELAVSPATVGEQRVGSIRVVVVPPVGMHFRVNAEDRQVLVLTVWAVE